MSTPLPSKFIRIAGTIQVAALLLFVVNLVAQQPQHATLAGRVVDDSTSAPLANVNVYIANTTLGGNTDENGIFEIRTIPVGIYDIVASRIGYSFHTFRAGLQEPRKRDFEIRLKPINVQMNEVVVSASDPTEWRIQLQKFNELFLGTTQNAKECRIANPEVLDFKSEGASVFEATARQPLEIDNIALGYHLKFFLKSFKVENDIMSFEGLPKFTELKPSSPKEKEQVRKSRMRAFRGSMRHFLIALFKKDLTRSGYSIFHLDFLQLGSVSSNRKLLTEDEILSASPQPTQKALRFSGFLEVEYWGEVENGYNLLQKAGTTGQVSWLALNYFAVGINERGTINEAFPTKVYGYWSWRRVGDMLPLDFDPEKD
jgi:hypothetical protein